MKTRTQLTHRIKQKALDVGYVACGMTDASPLTEYLDALEHRIRRYPESAHLYQKLRDNGYPKKQAEWAQSVIVCLSRYGKYRLPEGLDRIIGKYYLVDGRLPYATEYHAFDAFQTFLNDLGLSVMTPRLAVKWAAARAGLGQFGKNNFLYTTYGSWIMIKVRLVNERLDYDVPHTPSICPEHCQRCVDACPTHALEQPFMMDYGRCIAHLSFNLTTLPPENMRDAMGTWVYGCDVCQDVCPLNQEKWEARDTFPQLDDIAPYLTLERLFTMKNSFYEQMIQPRFWYIAKEHLGVWKRNALRAMANSRDMAYHGIIKEACSDPNASIRHMAHWALQHIGE